MPIRVGEMMVVVRAQDFASRTLRKVSGELAGMSRQQALAYRGQDVATNMRLAQSFARSAEANAAGLKTVGKYNSLLGEQAMKYRAMQDAAMKYESFLGPTRRANIRAAQQEIAVARQELDFFRNARKIGVTRSVLPPAQRTAGIEAASTRLANAHNALSAASTRNLGGMVGAERELQNAQRAYDQVTQSVSKYGEQIQRMPSWLRAAAGNQVAFAAATEKSARELEQAYSGLNKAQRAQLAFNQAVASMPINRLHDIGHAMTGIGRTMQLVGAIGTVAFGVSANAAANFNRQITLAATQTRDVGAPLAQTAAHAQVLEKAVLGLMQQFPASAEEMSKAAYDIYSSMTVSFGGGMKLLKLFNKVAVAGGVDLGSATQATITVLNNFVETVMRQGKVTKETSDTLDRMFSIVRFGRMNFDEFGRIMTFVAPAARGARQSLDSVSGAVAFLTRTIGAAKTGTALARLLDIFLLPEFQRGMKKAGAAITDATGKLKPFPQIIDQIASLKPTDANNIIRVITALGAPGTKGTTGFIQARRALTELVTHVRAYRTVQAQTVNDNEEFGRSFQAMSKTMGIQWQIFLNQLKVLVLYIGQQALPVFIDIGHQVAGWIKHWQNLSGHTQSLIIKIGVLVSVGTLLSGVILAIVGTITGLVASIAGLSKTFGGAGIEGSILGKMFTFAALGQTIARLGTIGLGIELIEKGGNWKTIGALMLAFGVAGKKGLVIGTATIGMKMVMEGGGWNTLIGSVLLAAGVGLATGSLVTAAITIPVILAIKKISEDRAHQNAINNLKDLQKKVEAIKATGSDIPITLQTQFEKAMRSAPASFGKKFLRGMNPFGFGSTQNKWDADAVATATKNAKLFIATWNKQVKNKAPSRIGMGDIQAALTKTKEISDKITLKEALKNVKSWTQLQDLVNSKLQQSASYAEQIATAIAHAAARGNMTKAFKLLDQYVQNSNRKITGSNVMKLLTQAVSAGDMQSAVNIINQFSQNMQQAASDMDSYQKQMVQRARDLQATIKQTTTDTIDSLTGFYQQLQQANTDAFGQLFQGPILTGDTADLMKEWGIAPSLDDMIKDLHAQNARFAEWRSNLNILFKKGLPRDFIKSIQAIGPEQGGELLKKLAHATPAQVQQLIAEWKRRNKQIKNATKLDFTNEINSFKKAGISMAQAIKSGFNSEQVGPWFQNWIKNKFPNLINAAVAQAVKEWKQSNPPPEKPKGAIGSRPGNAAGAHKPKPQEDRTKPKKSPPQVVVNYHDHGGGGPHSHPAERLRKRRHAFQIAQGIKNVQVVHGD